MRQRIEFDTNNRIVGGNRDERIWCIDRDQRGNHCVNGDLGRHGNIGRHDRSYRRCDARSVHYGQPRHN